MTLEQLNYFIDVAETHNITLSAGKFFISPQGLSRSLKNLQQELQTTLFLFHNGKLELTEQGLAYYTKLKDLVSQLNQLNREISQTKTRTIKVTIAAYTYPLLADLLESLQKDYPDLIFHFVEVPDKLADQMLIEGKTDLAFLAGPVHHQNLKVQKLAEADDVLVLPKDHRLASRKQLTFSDIKDEPFVTMNEQYKIFDCYVHHMRETACSPKIIFCASTLDAVKTALRLKRAVTMGNPQYAVSLSGFVQIPLKEKNKWQLHAAIHHSNTDPILAEIMRTCFLHRDQIQV